MPYGLQTLSGVIPEWKTPNTTNVAKNIYNKNIDRYFLFSLMCWISTIEKTWRSILLNNSYSICQTTYKQIMKTYDCFDKTVLFTTGKHPKWQKIDKNTFLYIFIYQSPTLNLLQNFELEYIC